MSGGRASAWVAICIAAAIVLPQLVEAQYARDLPLGVDAFMPVPDNNPLNEEKIALGRQLFFDPRLSADGRLSCAGCHDPAKAFTDGRRTSIGIGGRTGQRNAPALLNRGYGAAFFWDGRAASLEEQVLGPIEHPDELGATVASVVGRIRQDVVLAASFRAVFGRGVNRDDLARALAAYVRSLVAGDSPVDRYLAGDRESLSAQQQEGLRVFRGKGSCTSCHLGPLFSDERFHNTGVAWVNGTFQDEGRASVTGRPQDRGAFKTPTLRHIADTAPYMHDGSFDRLDDVIDFYDRGGRPNPHLDQDIRPLRLSAGEKTSLIAFLRALSGRIVR